CAHLLYGLQPAVMRDLGVTPELAADDLGTIALSADGRHVRMRGARVEGVSDGDRKEMHDFHRRMQRFSGLLRTFLNKAPPRLGTRRRQDLKTLAQLALKLRLLGKSDMREFLRVIGMNIYDEVEECFENPLLKGAISLDAVLGTHLGPRSPNTILTLLYRMSASGGRLSVPAGGMGRLTESLANSAMDAGVSIRTGTPVKRIIVDNGRATGVETADGEFFESLVIASNADPKHTIMELVGARHVETGFTRRIHNLRMRGNAAKLHLALDGLPAIKGLEKKDFGERLVIAPDPDYVERAFNPAKYGEYSPRPVMEITFPSLRDATLAPAGRHVMSAIVQYAPYGLRAGWNDASRDAFEKVIMQTLEGYAPGIGARVQALQLLTPVDIEERFGMGGGHWHHGELTLDQFLFVRPVSGAAQYAMPLDGLYLCGAGAHPGGNVSGAPGRNAARAILAREKAA
ncbi:MAG TPA: NAD(P)/FAD-dependent oxidoreductase, partial [Woeseiaceae bacterium]|nr:NAD(P)/FAD-dependent oxidoreductase [Woeseiaceae bacterium]